MPLRALSFRRGVFSEGVCLSSFHFSHDEFKKNPTNPTNPTLPQRRSSFSRTTPTFEVLDEEIDASRSCASITLYGEHSAPVDAEDDRPQKCGVFNGVRLGSWPNPTPARNLALRVSLGFTMNPTPNPTFSNRLVLGDLASFEPQTGRNRRARPRRIDLLWCCERSRRCLRALVAFVEGVWGLWGLWGSFRNRPSYW